MIEIEKNFDLKPGDKKRIIHDAEYVGFKTFTDVYYDDDDYELTSKDFWLRSRDGKFELKVPLNASGAEREITDRYQELESDQEIATALNLIITTDIATALREAGYKPFATITTKREQYRKGDFNLDFDEVRDLDYTTFEAELMISTPEEVPAAEARILDFAKKNGVTKPGRGKVIEYLLRHNQKHYEALVAAGVIR